MSVTDASAGFTHSDDRVLQRGILRCGRNGGHVMQSSSSRTVAALSLAS